ncbi:MAG: winged helix-turn-helix transcriptional regulator [Aureispira sp.]
MEKNYAKANECPITIFMTEIGGKWKPVIIWLLLLQEKKRFNELNRAIEGISQKVLAQQLKDLEHLGLILRTSYPEIPPRVEYTLTHKGKSLQPLLTEIMQWTTVNLIEEK